MITKSPEVLKRLSMLDLKRYAGNLNVLKKDDARLYEQLMTSPVNVKVVADKGICEDKLHEICQRSQGKHETFRSLRQKIEDQLFKIQHSLGWNLLTVSFDGIFVGEPEDLLNHRDGRQEGIMYPIKGLGEKIAEVEFV